MRTYIPPRPGTYQDIDFRSQLEIAWAKYFDHHDIVWDYVDEKTHDFEILYRDSTASLEIKPKITTACLRAIERIAKSWDTQDDPEPMCVLAGYPPNEYERPLCIVVTCLARVPSKTWNSYIPGFVLGYPVGIEKGIAQWDPYHKDALTCAKIAIEKNQMAQWLKNEFKEDDA